jgi:hypothetical protein
MPEGVYMVAVDRETGNLAGPLCSSVVTEAFVAGTEPQELCPLHNAHAGPDGRDAQEEQDAREPSVVPIIAR